MLSTDQPPSGCVELGSLLRAARRARGLSQGRLAELASGWAGYIITRDRIAQWEHAHRRVSAADLSSVELAMNVAFADVDRKVSSAHHAGAWCEASGDSSFTCRTMGTRL